MYVAETGNDRISQFSATGQFVRAWGYDVVAGGEHNTGASEQQSVTLAATVTGGSFTLRWPAFDATAAIPFNASAAQVQSALEALSTIGAGNVGVTSPNPGGGSAPGGPYTVTFQGAFSGNDAAQMTAVNTGLTGSPNTVTIATTVPGGGLEVCQAASSPTDVCKAGVAGATAGQLNNPMGLAVDQSNGYLYVTGTTNRRVDVFSGTGQFAGAFGFDVLPGDPNPSGPDFCTTATGCQAAAAAGANAGRFGSNAPFARPAVDPSTPGRVFVPDPGNLRMTQYSTTITAGVLTAVSFDKAFGWDVIPGGTVGLESCTTTCQAGQTTAGGNNPGQFTASSPTSVAVDSTGAIYATSGTLTGTFSCSTSAPCRVQKFTPDASTATTFGPSSGPGQLTFETGAANAVAGLDLAVDPDNDHLFVLRKETATTYRVVEYDSTGTHVDTHPGGDALTGPTFLTGYGLAIGTADRVYTNIGTSDAGQVFILGPIDPPGVTIDPVSGIEATTATFTGTVTIPAPGSPTFDTKYRFEYTKNGVVWTEIPVPDANVADGLTGTHTVSQTVSDLDPDTLYQVRLVATTGPSVTSSTVIFVTPPVPPTPPRVAMGYAEEVTETDAVLGAHVDPEGLGTSYHFEWGPTAAYGNNVPAFERQIGSGDEVVVAQEPIGGLVAQATYHYRVVATNSAGTTVGLDQTFETLNSCGLTDGRCYELVSPADKGAVASAGAAAITGVGLKFQAAPEGPRIAYPVAYGLDDSLAGNDVLYEAVRGGAGWSSSLLDVPTTGVTNNVNGSSVSQPFALSRDLSCGVYASPLALAEDAPARALDAGVQNLYRRNPGGSWTTITNLESQPRGDQWEVVGVAPGASGECGRVVFTTGYRFEGLSTAGARGLYEWVDGTLRNVGVVPGPGGPVVAAATPGAPNNLADGGAGGGTGSNNYVNAVSEDGSRIFFTADRQVSGLAAEVGKRTIFMREDGATTVDASKSQTAVANDGLVRYEMASKDGEHVFFTARYGLAANSVGGGPTSCSVALDGPNGAGCALYRYSVGSGVLIDLSVAESGTSNSAGAGVAGVIAASDDGSRVYFTARGRLVGGQGATQAANLAAGSYNVYLSQSASGSDSLKFVATVKGGPGLYVSQFVQPAGNASNWSSRVTGDGRRLLFEATGNVTGYDSGGPAEAYLYDVDTGSTVCVSCRRDRQESVTPAFSSRRLAPPGQNTLAPPVSLTADGSRAFFTSPNRLAVGATEGRPNVYQWEDGQISFLASSPHASPGAGEGVAFVGASASGDDVYFTTINRMSWQDTDAKLDVYDARVGGGFAPPAPIPTPCDPLAQGACSSSPGASGVDSSVKTGRGGDGDLQPPVRAVFTVGSLSKAQRARLVAGRRVGVAVRVSRPGTVSLKATAKIGGFRTTVISARRRATAAGRLSVPVVLSRAARARIARTGGLKVTLTVRFSGAAKKAATRIVLTKASRPKLKAKQRGGSRTRTATTDRRQGQ